MFWVISVNGSQDAGAPFIVTENNLAYFQTWVYAHPAQGDCNQTRLSAPGWGSQDRKWKGKGRVREGEGEGKESVVSVDTYQVLVYSSENTG